MGSIRMLYDMEHGPFPTEVIKDSDGPHPIKPGHIGYFLEVGQVASLSGLYSHSDPRSNQNDTVKSGVSVMFVRWHFLKGQKLPAHVARFIVHFIALL